ncbi:Flp pilus assembly protein CpaB [Geodermatophilus sp. SYSU D00691]
MTRRIIAALAALLLAGAGTVVLLAYVRGAEARALAGVESVEVLVVAETIPSGTPAEEVASLVDLRLVPAKVAATGRVHDLTALAGQVTTVTLQPGEQLLTSRFADPAQLTGPGIVPVPDGYEEMSVLLEPQRAVGGRLAAGDTVGVYVSLEFEDGTSTSHLVLDHVLVTQVQGAPAVVTASDDGESDTASAGTAAPAGSLMITLAVTARAAEAVVFGAEHGSLWLSLEPEGADTSGTSVVTQGSIYGKDYQ